MAAASRAAFSQIQSVTSISPVSTTSGGGGLTRKQKEQQAAEEARRKEQELLDMYMSAIGMED
jgi:hypothetical protein